MIPLLVRNDELVYKGTMKIRVKKQKRYFRSLGVRDILLECKHISLEKQGMKTDWNELIRNCKDNLADHPEIKEDEEDESISQDKVSDEFDEYEQPDKELITIGLVGHPNTGKSSLINGMFGKKVVSASRTPGHTKHFQTIHLTGNVRLCDCPGLGKDSVVF
jgi:ribosome biogenesis GTPase A